MICYDLLYACCICCTCCTRTGKLIRPISLYLCRTFADLKTSSRSRIPRQLGLGPSQGRRSNLWFSHVFTSKSSNCEALIFRPAMLRAQAVWPSLLPTRPCFYFVPCVSPFSSMILDAYPFHRCSCDMQRRRCCGCCGKKRRAFIAFQHFSMKSRLPERSERLQDVFLIVPDTWLRRPPIPLTRAARPGTCQMDCCEVI